MAKRTIQMLIDDLDGGDATETITFALDGTQFTIDLSTANATKLRSALAPYVASGAKVGRAGSMVIPRQARPAPDTKALNAAIRLWAQSSPWCQEKEYTVSDRGRIRSEVADAYPERLRLDALARQRADEKAAIVAAERDAAEKSPARGKSLKAAKERVAEAAVPAARRGRQPVVKATAPAE